MNEIYAYKDKQALEDGTIVDIATRGFELAGRPVNRATQAVYALMPPWIDDFLEKRPELAELAKLVPEVVEAAVKEVRDDINETFKAALDRRLAEPGVNPDDPWPVSLNLAGGKKHWLMPNETGGLTLMLPEDY